MKAKKIKRVKEDPVKDFIKGIEEDNKKSKQQAKETIEKRKQTMQKNKNEPSKASLFTRWKRREDIENWTAVDFFGWYLYCYSKYFEEEDVAYIGKYKGEQVQKEIYRLSYFLKNYFDGNKSEFRRFIRFGIKFAADPESFYTTFGFWSLFSSKMFMYKLFLQHKKKGKKFTEKRKKIDNDFSDNDAWAEI